MRISNKHINVQTVTFADFTGGLNTTNAATTIAENELAQSINVEIDKSTGLLKTCCGTDVVYKSSTMTFEYLLYDAIGNNILLVDASRKLYRLLADNTIKQEGIISGVGAIEYTLWEDGIVITSGGRLQYYHSGTLETITDTNAPTKCHCPLVKDGRIYLAEKDEIHCSGVGDEHNWTTDSNDASSSQWLQIGYKDGGSIVGISALSSDIIVFKDNNRAYRLTGSFPDWSVTEIGRSIDCKGFNCCIAISNNTLSLGSDGIQSIQVTDEYGDMKATNISTKVSNLIKDMDCSKLRYVKNLNQVWIINNSDKFLFLELPFGGFYQRQYMTATVDVADIGNDVYVLKSNGLYKLNKSTMEDEGYPLAWKIQGKTLVSNNEYLIKKMWVDVTPYFYNYANSVFKADKITLNGPVPFSGLFIYHDYTPIYQSNRGIRCIKENSVYSNSEEVYHNPEYIYKSDIPVRAIAMYRRTVRQVDRNKSIKISAYGRGGMQLINSISIEVADV